jgi:uncharacterized protein (DUF697 family)
VSALSLLKAARELRGEAPETRPLVVAGARELVPILARELRAGGDASAVQEGGSAKHAVALVWIGPPDEDVLREAHRAKVPIVGVTEGQSLPYVLDTDIVTVRGGRGFPVAEIAAVLARQLRERGAGVAARLPVLRDAVVDQLIATSSRHNALISAGLIIPGVDMAVLTFNEVRLVLRIARAYGRDVDPLRSPEVLGVVGAGFGWRAVARELLDAVPVAGWAVKGGIAYTGTRSVGEAARRYFAAKT